MPELCEAEATIRAIADAVRGQRLMTIDFDESKGPLKKIRTGWEWYIIKVEDVWRRGKKVVFQIPEGFLVSQLGMSGYWDIEDQPWTFDYVEFERRKEDAKHVRIRAMLENGRYLRYHDARKFGSMRFYEKLPPMGPEPISSPFVFPKAPLLSFDELVRTLTKPRPIKAHLMDQSVVAGIGNIYANEICHSARIDPMVVTYSLTLDERERIWWAIQGILNRNIGGIDYSWLAVYRRDRCGSCGAKVVRELIEKRATFRCVDCQPAYEGVSGRSVPDAVPG